MLNPEDIPDPKIRSWYKKKSEKDYEIDVLVQPDLYEFASERMKYFGISDNNVFISWLKNRSIAISERNKREIILSCKPLYLDVEINNSCNLKCKFCPCRPGHGTSKLTGNELDILEELFPYAEIMETSKAAEPFTTPDLFIDLLKRVRKVNPFVIIHCVTNGTINNEDVIKDLIEYKLDHIYISLSGDSRLNYKEITQKDLFDKVIHNLKRIRDLKLDESGEPYVHFNCQMSSYADPFKILDIADEYNVIEVNFIKTQYYDLVKTNFAGKAIQEYKTDHEIEDLMDKIIEKANSLEICINFSGWDTKTRHGCGPKYKYYYPSSTKYFNRELTCPTDAPWFRYCTAMENVSPCCWSGSFAKWTEQPFDDIWNCEHIKKMRKQIALGEYPSNCNCRY